jgi:hypothetical protein
MIEIHLIVLEEIQKPNSKITVTEKRATRQFCFAHQKLEYIIFHS